jgi:cellobiose phosphorylase
VPVKIAQEQLCHSILSSTRDIYTHVVWARSAFYQSGGAYGF